MREMADNSIDSVVTDPPYFLTNRVGSGFMGKPWDSLSPSNAIVDALFRSMKLDSNSDVAGTVAAGASTPNCDLKVNQIENVQSVQRDSTDAQARLNPNIHSAHRSAITKPEALALCRELSPNHTKLLEKLPSNACFVIQPLFIEHPSKNIARSIAGILLDEPEWLDEITTFISTAKIKTAANSTEGRIGHGSESKSINEIIGPVESAGSSALGLPSNATTSCLIDYHEITQRIISLPFAKDVINQCTKNPNFIPILSEVFHSRWSREVFRILKPGGHLLSFGGTRTYHRMVSAIEDSGFECRDMISWIYGSGFPKSHDVSKAIDKLHGMEREVVGENPNHRLGQSLGKDPGVAMLGQPHTGNGAITAPATPDAVKWAGFGTALKPATEIVCLATKPLSTTDQLDEPATSKDISLSPHNEPIVLARKPLEHSHTIAANVLKHGTGALNIDASRISGEPWKAHSATGLAETKFFTDGHAKIIDKEPHIQGRWPANLILGCACEGDIHDAECPVGMLDAQSGNLGKSAGGGDGNAMSIYGSDVSKKRGKGTVGFGDTGGASRFFFIARTDKSSIVNKCELAEQSLSHGKKTESNTNNQSIDGYGNRLTGLFQPDTISITETETGSTINFQILNASKLVPIGQCTLKIERNISQSEALSIESVSVAENGECLIAFQNGLLAPIRGIVKNVPQNILQNGEIITETIGINTTENTDQKQATSTTKPTLENTVKVSTPVAGKDTERNLPANLRFFYVAKASKRERNAGLDGMPEKRIKAYEGGDIASAKTPDSPGGKRTAQNHHPTVKPIRLMEYLIRLITPHGGRVLDPFAGSGSTGVACKRLGFEFIGIELDEAYAEIAVKRIEACI